MEFTAPVIDLASAERFEPAMYSIPDLLFLLDNLGTAPAVAMRKPEANEPGVRAVRIKRLLTDVYNLEQIRAAEGNAFGWAGIDALTDSIARFIAWHDRSNEIRRRRVKDATGALVTHPSQYGWDEDGRAYKFAVDADAAAMVTSEITDTGDRKTFGVSLLQNADEVLPDISTVAPWIKSGPKGRITDSVTNVVDKKLGTFTCSICAFSQQYPKGDRTKQNMAMARMRKHMGDAKTDTNRHRLLLLKLAR